MLAAGPQPVTMGRLAGALALETQSTTGLIDRMERQGWVARHRDLAGRRAIRVALTDLGHSVLSDATAATQPAFDRLVGGLTLAELATLARLLSRAYEHASGPAAPPDPEG